MLGTVLDRITKLFGRAFFISAFFPVVLFVAANVTVAAFYVGWEETSAWWNGVFENKALVALLLFVGVTATAYLVMIVSPMLKRVLEGRYERGPFARHLRARKVARFTAAEQKAERDLDEVCRRREACARLHDQLVSAFRRHKEPGSPPTMNERLERNLADLERKLARLRGKGLIGTSELEECAVEIEGLYDRGASAELIEKPHRQVDQLLQDVVKVAEQNYAASLMDLSSRFARSTGTAGVRITTLGNVMNAIWTYPYDRYCIDPVATWPQLQTVIPKEYFPTVEDARISYDFAVVCTYLSVIVATSWASVVAWDLFAAWPIPSWPGLAPILAVAGGLIAMLIFRALAIEAARSFGAVFRTCFDLYRFELLKKLSLPLPADLAEERTRWEKVNHLLVHGDWSQDLSYAHDGKPPKAKPESAGNASRPVATPSKAQVANPEAGFFERIFGLLGGG